MNVHWFPTCRRVQHSLLKRSLPWGWETRQVPNSQRTISVAEKINADGEVIKRKVRIIAKGYTKVWGEDFWNTYSPTLECDTLFSSLRCSVCLLEQWTHQGNIPSATGWHSIDPWHSMVMSGEDPIQGWSGLVSTGIDPVCRGLASLEGSPSLLGQWSKWIDLWLAFY